jgi:hypothetical protein
VEFRILGPLEVVDGDRPLALKGSRLRGLLVLLLTSVNEAVSADREDVPLVVEFRGGGPGVIVRR